MGEMKPRRYVLPHKYVYETLNMFVTQGEQSCILIHDEIDKYEHIILGMVVRETRRM